MEKKNQNRQKLLVQIGLVTGIYSLLAILVAGGVLSAVARNVYLRAKEEQMGNNLAQIYNNVLYDKDVFWVTDRVVDYWEANPLVMREYIQHRGTLDEEYRARFDEYTAGWSGENAWGAEFVNALPEEFIEIEAGDDYSSFFYWLLVAEDYYQYERFLVLDVSEGHEGTILFDADNGTSHNTDYYLRNTESWGAYYFDRHHIFARWSEDPDSMKAVTEIAAQQPKKVVFQADTKTAGAEKLTGYYPVWMEGKLRFLIMVKLDWADFLREEKEISSRLFGIAFLLILLIQTILLIYVYRVSVRPLKRIKNVVSEYIITKDSDVVVQKMREIRQKNEFGELAEDISGMVREIDRYTEENIELAGEKEKAATELELAAKIQNGMLRRDFPKTAQYEIYALMDPAKEVGGDFYDFFEIDSAHLGLVIADVAGKGVPGSLYMMSAMTVIRDKTQNGESPAEILAAVNREMLKGDFGDMFVTVWLGILDLERGVITAANAGHEYPIVKMAEHFRLLKDKHGFVVGGMDGMKYQDYEIDLGMGGTLFVYTDGVPEATAADDELYGTERIVDTLNRDPDAAPGELVRKVKEDVDRFVGRAEQFDDLTILCIRYLA